MQDVVLSMKESGAKDFTIDKVCVRGNLDEFQLEIKFEHKGDYDHKELVRDLGETGIMEAGNKRNLWTYDLRSWGNTIVGSARKGGQAMCFRGEEL